MTLRIFVSLELALEHGPAKTPYALGEKEFHVAFYTDSYDALLQKHKAAGIVVTLEEPELRLYFVEDPDGYRVEVVELPARP